MIEDHLTTALLAMPAVTAIVGSGDDARIWSDHFPQETDLPAILLEVDTADHGNTLDGRGGLVQATLTLTCRAATKRASRELAEAVRTGGTDPGSGLAGYSDEHIDAVLESTAAAYVHTSDGGDDGRWDTVMEFALTYAETT